MKKTLTIIEARKVFGDNCFETETGFLVNRFGKYQPNITFVVGKELELDANGKPVNPLTYVSDREVTDGMNMDFDGDAKFMFGDFWRSKKGGACFRPKNPMEAEDLLIKVQWGGCYNYDKVYGTHPSKALAIAGVKYFRHASSNAGGAGNDYWVVPVGWSANLPATEFAARAKVYCEKHAERKAKRTKANEEAFKALLAKEEVSRGMRASFDERMRSAQERIARVEAFHRNRGTSGHCGLYLAAGPSYFYVDSEQLLYTEENVRHMEEKVARCEAWAEKLKVKDAAKAEFSPKFEVLEAGFVALGYKVEYGLEEVVVIEPFFEANRWFPANKYPRELRHKLGYSDQGIKSGATLLAQLRKDGASETLKEMIASDIFLSLTR